MRSIIIVINKILLVTPNDVMLIDNLVKGNITLERVNIKENGNVNS